MNISYRSVWNRSIGAWVAVSEVVRGRGKRGRGAAARALAVAALALTGAGSHAQTIVDQGPLVVSSDAQLGADSVVVDNTLNRNATLKINSGVSIGNEIILNNGGTLNNAGTISRTAVDDTAVRSDVGGATVNNAATGRIFGEYVGVGLEDGGTVNNTGGTISAAAADGDDKGVYIQGKPGAVTNQAGGSIMGVAVGVKMEAGGTVNNIGAGSVISVGGTGVTISGGNGTVTNSGTIAASGVDGQGVVIGGGTAQVTNSGTIQALGSGGRAIYLYADPGDTLTVNNQAGGKIIGAGTGVQLNGNGTVTNSGQISTTAADGMGVYFGTAAGAVVNTQGGTITGGAAGVQFDFGGDVTNTGGTIRATTDGKNLDGGHGVAIVGGLGTVINQGGGTIAGKLYGVSLADGGTITNIASTISADGMDPLAAGVGISGAPGTVTNTGAGSLIKGPAAGVRLIDGGTVINGAGATIQGKSAVEVIAGNATLSNAGALVGNVVLRGASTNKVTLFTGSSITGNLGIGTNAASMLTLDGLGDQLYSNAVTGTTTLGSGSVVKVGSGTWTMDKAMTRSGATQVAAGTLVVANNTALGTGSVTVDNTGKAAATLQVDAGFSITNQVVVNNGGTLNNSGTVTRTGANQIAVETKVGGGTINNTGGRLAATGTNTMGVKVTNGVGTVTNQKGGTIAGGEAGIWLTGGGSVRNTGAGSAISSGASASLGYGVYATSATASVTVTNEAGASIAGKTSSVYLGAGGSVINDGLASKISADANGSVGVSIGALSGTALGIVNNLNGATIQGANGGVVLYNGGEIFNDVASVIKANTAVIVMSGGTRLTNKGQLIGGVNLNFQNPPQAHQVTLFTGSSITGSLGIGSNAASTLTLDGTGQQRYANAVGGTTSFSAGTLVKQGLGTWTLDQAMTRSGATQVAAGTLAVAHGSGLGSGTVTVDNTGRLGATLAVDSGVSIGNAVIVNNTGTLNNTGTISQTATGQKAVISDTGGATVNNAATGRIEGDTRGVDLVDGGTVTNAGGTIHANAAGSYGVATGGVAATVSNTLGGTISGVQAGVAVWGSGGNTVDNNGATITASIGHAVYVQNSGATVTNRGGGKITGEAAGVLFVAGGTLINDADSTIEGTAGAAVLSNLGGAVTLRNAGKVIGDVNLASSGANEAHEITLYTGSSIMGRLQAATQASTLTLDGAGDQLYSKAVTGTTTFAGTLVKKGLGNWTLDQTQNGLTTGNARIDAGTLNVATKLNSTRVDVLSGATLTGSGTLAGAVNIADGGHLALLSGSTLSAASLVLGANSNLDVALGAPSDTRLLNLTGNLTLDGKLNVTDAGGFGRGAYRLIDYGGSLTNNGLDLGDLPLGYKAGDMTVQTSVAKQVNLVVGASSGTLRFWNGNVLQADGTVHGGGGTWNAGSTNWTTTDGSASQAWAHDFGIFSGSGGTVTVNGTQGFSGLQFSIDGYALVNGTNGKLTAVNDSDGYAQIRVDAGATARIAIAIDGGGKLDKRDRGTLVLSGANSYTGGTAVHGGTLATASNTALGTGTVTVDNSGNFDARLEVNAGVRIGNQVIVNNLGALDNSGTILRTAAGQKAVVSATGGATVNNAATGRIEGDTRGVDLVNGGTVTNAGGTIHANATINGTAVATGGVTATVNNTLGGVISGQETGVAMYGSGGNTVVNTGATIRADKAGYSGVYVIGGAANITNTEGGLIAGDGNGLFLQADTATVVNGAASTIQGKYASLYASKGDVTFSNAGKMIGNVALSDAGTHKVTLVSGSVIEGTLEMGTNAASTLTLDGTGVQLYSRAVTGDTTFAGTLIKQGSGTWTLDQASARSGGTSLKAGRLNLGHSMALGTGTLSMDDGTTLGFAADGLTIANAIHMTGSNDPVIDTGAFSETLAGVISGGGFLTKQGTGTLILAGANVYTGATNVAAGTLRAGAANTFASSSAHSVAAGATFDTAGFDQTVAALANAGIVNLRSAGGAVGSTLTVTGPYVGNNGVLQVATALGDSASAGDRLLLSGASAVASGSTQVQVTNVAGLGALTKGNGIPVVVTENGARIEANAFSLPGGHVDAGAFEYRIGGDAQGVYLRSTDAPVALPVDPAAPVNPAGLPSVQSLPLYRAEVPLIAALPEQLREANLAMLANRSQRVGDIIGADAPANSRQAWGRILTVQRDIQQGGAISPQSHGRLTGFQAGTDLFAGGDADAQWQAGIYVGQLDGDMSASGFARGITNLQAGRNTLRNQYLGAYGSYQGSSGLYAEAVLQAGRHRYSVEAITNTAVNGKGSSLLASLEVGQSFQLAPGWRIEPQLQIVHQSLDLDDLALGGLTTVGQNTKSGWSLRAGIRVQGELLTGIGTLKPYGRLNVYRSPNGTDSASYRTPAALTVIGTPTGGTRTELAAGAALALSASTAVYGEIGQLRASGGNTRTRGGVNASVGVKVRW